MPSAFTGALKITSIDADCRVWRLDEPLTYEVGSLGSGRLITVPAGFLTDGASIPRVLQGVLPAWGRWSRAAVIHDYLCRAIDAGDPVYVEARWVEGAYGLTLVVDARRRADAIFHEALLVSGVSRPLAWVMWLAVRAADRWPALREVSPV